jgi:hypothetical protein
VRLFVAIQIKREPQVVPVDDDYSAGEEGKDEGSQRSRNAWRILNKNKIKMCERKEESIEKCTEKKDSFEDCRRRNEWRRDTEKRERSLLA